MQPDITGFIETIRGKGVTLSVEGDRLRASPRRLLSADESAFIVAHKPDLIAALSDPQSRPSPTITDTSAAITDTPSEPPTGNHQGEAVSGQPAAGVSSANGGSGTEHQPAEQPQAETPDFGVIAGVAIRLNLISKQLAAFNDGLEALGSAMIIGKYTDAMHHFCAVIDALPLTRGMVDELCRELGDATEHKEN